MKKMLKFKCRGAGYRKLLKIQMCFLSMLKADIHSKDLKVVDLIGPNNDGNGTSVRWFCKHSQKFNQMQSNCYEVSGCGIDAHDICCNTQKKGLLKKDLDPEGIVQSHKWEQSPPEVLHSRSEHKAQA